VVSLNLMDKLFKPEHEIEGLTGDELKEVIKGWFLSNFEDPAENTPYEGGYLYIWGGPYDAREQIGDYFGGRVAEEIINEVVEDLERIVVDWAPSSNRIYDEDPPEEGYVNLQAALDNLEIQLGQVRAVSPAIGDNNPPEDIGAPPYSTDDEVEIREIIEILRAPEPVLIRNADKALEAASLLKFRADRIEKFFADQGQKFADAFSVQLGKRSADAIVLGAVFALGVALKAVYDAAHALLSALHTHLPF
jgi:hypothetical protein